LRVQKKRKGCSKMRKQPKTLHAAKLKIAKYEKLLWKSYDYVKNITGTDCNDFLTESEIIIEGPKEYLNPEGVAQQLKEKLRKVFE